MDKEKYGEPEAESEDFFSEDSEYDFFDITDIPDENDIDWEPSKRYKIRMNRLFRKALNNGFIPYPEVDNVYERVRSYLVVHFGPPDKY